MFEDLARNLVVPHQLGMTTVLVVPDGTKEVVREDWELEGRDAAYVDHVTDDLTGFLQRLGGTDSLTRCFYRSSPVREGASRIETGEVSDAFVAETPRRRFAPPSPTRGEGRRHACPS